MTVLLSVAFASVLMNPQWPWSPVKRSVQELAANIPVPIAIETLPPVEELLAPDDWRKSQFSLGMGPWLMTVPQWMASHLYIHEQH